MEIKAGKPQAEKRVLHVYVQDAGTQEVQLMVSDGKREIMLAYIRRSGIHLVDHVEVERGKRADFLLSEKSGVPIVIDPSGAYLVHEDD